METISTPTEPPVNEEPILPYREAKEAQLKVKPRGFTMEVIQDEEVTNPEELIKLSQKKVAEEPSMLEELDNFSKKVPPVETVPEKKGKEFNLGELRKKNLELSKVNEDIQKERDSYRSKVEELTGTLEKSNFQASPRFKEKFLTPVKEAEEQASSFAKDIGISESLVTEALKVTGKDRIAFIDENFASPTAGVKFLHLIDNLESKQGSLNKALDDYKATQLQFQEAEKLEKVKQSDQISDNFNGMAKQVASKISFFREKDGDEEHNKAVKERTSRARAIVTGEASEEEIMLAPFYAAITRDSLAKISLLEEELKRYKNRASEDTRANPRVNSGNSTPIGKGGKPVGGMASILAQIG